jgi:tight adherence protein B
VSGLLSAPWLVAALVFLACALAIQSLYRLIAGTHRYQTAVDRRLASSAESRTKKQPLDMLREQRGLTTLEDGRFSRLNTFLIQTGLRVSKPRLLLWTAALSIAIAAALWLAVAQIWLTCVGGLILAPVIVALYLSIVRRRRIERFTGQLPDALAIIVRSLRIGHPLTSAVELAAREMAEPIGSELGLTAEEITFGQDVTTAVDNLHRRVGQDDLVFFVVAVSVQSQTGGNLADVLARLAALMRERATLELKVKALSAEGRLSGWFLSAMPFVLYGAIRLLSRDYFSELTGSAAFTPALIYGSLSLILSNLVIYRMVRFRI